MRKIKKRLKFVVMLLLVSISGINAQTCLSFPVAKFKTGDNATWKERDYDDSKWTEIKTSQLWESQGIAGYDGFAWYRIHFFLPASLLDNSYLKNQLSFYLARIDDADEVYLNGKLIGKTGSFPLDSHGYVTQFEVLRNYTIDLKNSSILWNQENVLAVKVYDGEGGGGIYGGTPSLQLYDLIDGLVIDYAAQNNYKESNYRISLRNTLRETQKGKLQILVEDTYNSKIIHSISENIGIASLKEWSRQIPLPGNKRCKIKVIYTDDKTGKFKNKEIISSYILTPPAPAQPRFNGPKVYGARPNHPFLFTVAASGARPMTFEAKGLPEGLALDPEMGIITGKTVQTGNYKVTLIAKNAEGSEIGELTIKIGDEIALTPPMGWNSWNCWGLSVDTEKVLQTAHAFQEKGLMQYGWSYINIDGGWQDKRDSNGNMVPNKKFPNMKALGDNIHQLGLKFGIYSSPGPRDCAGYIGSYQHEQQDAKIFAGWGVDYLKYDWCYYSEVFDTDKDNSTSAYMKPYLLMQKYLREQNRDIVYSLCQYGFKDVWEWGAAVGNSWRTTWDITDSWESLSDIGFNQYSHWTFAKPGHWNDPDMLIVGKVGWGENLRNTRLTPDEQYTHISLWSLLASPLLIGCDVSQLDDFTLSLLTNHEVLAINQDSLGKQAQRLVVDGNIQLWVK
ncbi:MAG: putative Ig domain-containing protein, partial [Bacteroidales bacterium]|nr:putative Ig domain-containing protein [Bacteroidales bacterium]